MGWVECRWTQLEASTMLDKFLVGSSLHPQIKLEDLWQCLIPLWRTLDPLQNLILMVVEESLYIRNFPDLGYFSPSIQRYSFATDFVTPNWNPAFPQVPILVLGLKGETGELQKFTKNCRIIKRIHKLPKTHPTSIDDEWSLKPTPVRIMHISISSSSQCSRNAANRHYGSLSLQYVAHTKILIIEKLQLPT